MKVLKRNGNQEEVSFDKIIFRLKNLAAMEPQLTTIDAVKISQQVCSRVYDGVTTRELDNFSAQICMDNITVDSEYGELGKRIVISNLHKTTSPSFSETVYLLAKNGAQIISDEIYDIVMTHKEKFNSVIDYSRDYFFDYFGFKTLEKAYLLKVNG